MLEKSVSVEWVCERCGVSGIADVLAGLSDWGLVSRLVLTHSLASNGCDGDARTCLRRRDVGCSDSDWECTKEKGRNRAAKVHHKEQSLIVAGEPLYSISSLREYLSGEPRWDDMVRAARYLR